MQKCLNQNSRVAFKGWPGFFIGELDKLDIKSPNVDFLPKLDTALMHQAALAERHCLGYAKELSRSIHLNPVRAKIVETPDEYDWSSYIFYTGKKLKEIGTIFGVVYSTVSQNRVGLKNKLKSS